MAVFRVEAGIVDEVDTAADHISGGERRAVRLSCPRRTEGVPIITVVPIRVLIPACERQDRRTGQQGPSLAEQRGNCSSWGTIFWYEIPIYPNINLLTALTEKKLTVIDHNTSFGFHLHLPPSYEK